MLRTFSQAVITTALLAAAASSSVRAGSASELCALPTASLESAVSQYAGCADALKEVNKHAIATWYTDRESVESYTKKITDITAHCDASTRMTLVVYGLPNKDCEAGYSTGGVNKNAEDYKKWVQLLADGVGQRKVLYVLEPDAVGLMAKGGCGTTAGYAENIKAALQILSGNPNADIYMDVGYWTLMSDSDAKAIASTVKELVKGGRLKGIALNTSNYRSNKQMSEMCSNFQKAYGDNSLNCIVDTSRNYNESPPSSEWCNANFGGVGRPPTAQTGFSNLDYFIWIKPAGESDGACDGAEHNAHSMRGPGAGQFFKQHFETLWNNGYFVKEKNYPVIGSGSSTTTQKPADQATTTTMPSTTTPPSSTQNTDTTQSTETTPPPVGTTSAPETSTSTTPATEVTTTPTPTPTEAVATIDTSTTAPPSSVSSTPSAQQYESPVSETPASETRENSVSTTPTPESSKPKKKKKKTKTKCDSGLEPIVEADNTSTVASTVKTASLSSTEAEESPATVAAAYNSTEVKSTVSFSSTTADSASAPDSSTPAVEQASTKSDGAAETGGIGGGAIAGMVAAAVVAVAAAAVAFRRRGEARRRANELQTPVEIFGPITATASRVQML